MTGHPSIRPNTKITNSERPHLLKFMKVNTCCNTLPTLKTRVKKGIQLRCTSDLVITATYLLIKFSSSKSHKNLGGIYNSCGESLEYLRIFTKR